MGQRIDDCLIPPLGITVKRKTKGESVKQLLLSFLEETRTKELETVALQSLDMAHAEDKS